VSAIIILIFFTIYASSGLVAAGRLFESMLGIPYAAAVVIGAATIVVYTFLGGFLAVSWTDLIQGTLMVIAIVAVPSIAYNAAGGAEAVGKAMDAANISTSLMPSKSRPILAVISSLAWGLGYFGQPHILARFMGIRSAAELPRSMKIALTWVAVSLAGAVISGFIATAMYKGLSGGDHEKVFIYMVRDLFNPWVGGILLAAIMSAVMSTIDSQLLVCSSALAEDFYDRVIKRDASEQELVFIGRGAVIIVSVAALLMAFNPDNTVLDLVAYAWGGFGAAFGPLIIASLYMERTTWKSALGGMVTGTVVLIFWKHSGLGDSLYEIVPGFGSNFIVIFILNSISSKR